MLTEKFNQAKQLYNKPLFELLHEAHTVYTQHYPRHDIQKCTLLSIKTGACPEDCAYCPQSVHYKTSIKREKLLSLESVKTAAENAKANGAERFCMGAAWRNVRDGKDFDRVIEMVKAVSAQGLEVCVTLGMLTEEQALRLKNAGVYAYNHNLDTSRDYYKKIIGTRTYDDRLKTIQRVRKAGMTLCCGGIIGMQETKEDRCALLAELASLDPYPESVPINLLVPVQGTPLAKTEKLDSIELIRTIAVARILMPKSRVRLSAGRDQLNREAHLLAFYAGANSIFLGEKLLTQSNPEPDADNLLLKELAESA